MSKKKLTVTAIGLCIVVALVAIDIQTKIWARMYLAGQEDITLIDGVLCLHYLENTGAAFGILKGQLPLFYCLTAIICFGIVFYLWRLPLVKKNLFPAMNLLVLLAGAIGNLKDRITHGYVVDFIYFSLIDFPVFNVADIYVTVSVFLLMIWMIFFQEDTH